MTNNGTPCISGGYVTMTENDSDLIRRSDALGCFHDWIDKYGDVHTPDEMAEYRAIEELPSVEPERKKGKWIDAVLPNDNGGLPVQVCDQCNTFFPLAYTGGGHRFCPKCGAKMEYGAYGI